MITLEKENINNKLLNEETKIINFNHAKNIR